METNFASRLFHGLGEMLTPVLASSHFVDRGVLTPEEFVLAGDLLVYKCPSWEWSAGEASCRKAFLPRDKQFLITRGIPSGARARDLEEEAERHAEAIAGRESLEEDGEWVDASFNQRGSGEDEGVAILHSEAGAGLLGLVREEHVADGPAAANHADAGSDRAEAGGNDDGGDDGDDDDDYADLTEFVGDNLAHDPVRSPAAMAPSQGEEGARRLGDGYLTAVEPEGEDGILRTRSYDISLCYDKYYQTPRVYMSGRTADGEPLSPEQMMEDVMQDYANRTVTVEQHPHLPSEPVQASIHPCRHAAAMKRILDTILDTGVSREEMERRVDTYLFIFLKFIQSVIPTINYDHTIEVSTGHSSHHGSTAPAAAGGGGGGGGGGRQ